MTHHYHLPYYADFNEAFGGTVMLHKPLHFQLGQSPGLDCKYEPSMYHFQLKTEVRLLLQLLHLQLDQRFALDSNINLILMLILLTILLFIQSLKVQMKSIPSQGNNTFSSFIMYVVTPDVAVTISNVNILTFDTDGTTELKTEYAYFKEAFGGATYSSVFYISTEQSLGLASQI